MKNIAIFASGTGTNFTKIYEAIKNKELNANIKLFVSDKENSQSAQNALNYNIQTFLFNPKNYQNKTDYEKLILEKLQTNNIDLIILAGYMRLIGKTLLDAYPNKIINIHPSLLPNYPGLHAIERAYNDKVSYSGITIHYVDSGMDTGSIIKQVKVKLEANDTLESFENKIHKVEHNTYKLVIKNILEG